MPTRTRVLTKFCGGLAILATLPALPTAHAAAPPTATTSPKLDASPSTFTLNLSGRSEYQFEGDLDSGDGSVSIARAGGNASIAFPVGTNSNLRFSWDSEFSWYDWSDASAFSRSASDPWDDTAEHSLGTQLFVPVNERWSWFAGAGARASFERDASFSDSLTYAVQGGARYKFNDAFSLSGGLAVRSRLEDDAAYLPIIGFDWKINEKLLLTTQRGTGLQLRYTASDAITLTLEGGYESREFRLRENAATDGGVGADRRVPVAAGVVWTLAPTVSVSAKGGLIAWSHYKLEDQDGVKISETDGDPAAFVSISVDFKF